MGGGSEDNDDADEDGGDGDVGKVVGVLSRVRWEVKDGEAHFLLGALPLEGVTLNREHEELNTPRRPPTTIHMAMEERRKPRWRWTRGGAA